jgi:two-component system LytT family response regulator
MRVIIVNDEALARGAVREYLAEHAEVDSVAECANGVEAVKAIAEQEPDLAILAIEMSKLRLPISRSGGQKVRSVIQ